MSERFGSCDFLATQPLYCPLCRVLVPANTPHQCLKTSPQTAAEKFHVGQRVRLVKGLSYRSGTPTGVVVSFAKRRKQVVNVRRDSAKAAEPWHMDRWEPIDEDA